MLTPLHRGFAEFGERNVQPDESYSNARGTFIGDVARAITEAGRIWSVPVIDLYALSIANIFSTPSATASTPTSAVTNA
jgi:hypothetical protein